MELDQYTIVLVDLNPTKGSEIKKIRPCVIISPIEMNKHLRTIVVARMTTNLKKYPSRISLKHNKKKGMVALDQIRTIDKKRLISKLGKLSVKDLRVTLSVLQEMFIY